MNDTQQKGHDSIEKTEDAGLTITSCSIIGKYHASQGGCNEDSIRTFTDDQHLFFCISDGGGCSDMAKVAAESITATAIDYCQKMREKMFDFDEESTDYNLAVRHMIFEIQAGLLKQAMQENSFITKMMATLLLVAIDRKNKTCLVVHVGDGAVVGVTENEKKILSYPENGITSDFTYFVNSPNVFSHLRVARTRLDNNEIVIAGTDGAFEGCFRTSEFLSSAQSIINTGMSQKNDDATYCIIRL